MMRTVSLSQLIRTRTPWHTKVLQKLLGKKDGKDKPKEADKEPASEADDENPGQLQIPHGERLPIYPNQLVTDEQRINTAKVAELTNRAAVHSIVASSLFPRVKFLDPVKDLERLTGGAGRPAV